MILKYNEFVNEMFNGKSLIYYSFDVDDNLIFAKTKIHMDKKEGEDWVPVDLSTEEFAVFRNKDNYRIRNGVPDEAFSEFRDFGPRGDDAFFLDFQEAVKTKKLGPSWNKFIECLVNGYIFAIITSRGHSVYNVQRTIEWVLYESGVFTDEMIDEMITNLLGYNELFGDDPDSVIDEYLSKCPVYCISSPEFKEKLGNYDANTAKKVALRDFTRIVNGYANKLGCKAKLGFSDDDPKFVSSAIDEFTDLTTKNKNIDFTVFDTGGKGMKKIKI